MIDKAKEDRDLLSAYYNIIHIVDIFLWQHSSKDGNEYIIISIFDAILTEILTRIFHQTWKMHPKIILETDFKFDKMIFQQE